MTPEQKAWIDGASLPQLLERWRFGEVGSVWFQGECGAYFSQVLNKKRNTNHDAWVAASKAGG
jgi:hypothetical protein